MENVFEMPKEEVVNEPVKKERKKRKPMSEEAKKQFVERMRASRKKKMEDKIRKEMETASGSPLKKTETSQEVIKNVINTPEAPRSEVPQNSPVKTEIRQPTFDYSHFNNLTNNIQLLNDTLTSLSKRDIERNKKAMEVAIPKAIEVAIPKAMEAPVKAMESPIKVIDDSPPVRQKEKIWNCGKRCFVYR